MGNSLPRPIKDAKQYLSEHSEYVDKSLRYVLGVSALGIVGFVLGKELKQLYNTYIRSEGAKRSQGAVKLLEQIKVEEETDYIARKDLEALLNDIVGTIYDRKYIILVGQKGSGKTTILNHVMNKKKGIVFIRIDGKTTLENLEQILLQSIHVQIEPWNEHKAQVVFGEICASVRENDEKDDKKIKWVPTVIFEVEGSTSKEIIKELYKTAKQLTCDKVQARCMIVLSDANACLAMTDGNLVFLIFRS
jgi:energy-coupling factor transporter ATP-binding protein EcfA2